jgi:hypothetical protein
MYIILKKHGVMVVRFKNQKIGKPNNLIVFGSNKARGPKQDSQNWLWSPIPEGGEP